MYDIIFRCNPKYLLPQYSKGCFLRCSNALPAKIFDSQGTFEFYIWLHSQLMAQINAKNKNYSTFYVLRATVFESQRCEMRFMHFRASL